jgi:hypothetical protein
LKYSIFRLLFLKSHSLDYLATLRHEEGTGHGWTRGGESNNLASGAKKIIKQLWKKIDTPILSQNPGCL